MSVASKTDSLLMNKGVKTMNRLVQIISMLFLSYSCVPSGGDNKSEGDGTANPSTSSGINSTQTSTDTDTSTDSELSLSAPSDFLDGDIFEASSDHYTLSWSAVDNALSYEVAVGTSSGATDVLDWQDVGNNTSISTSTLSLPAAGMFYASVRAVGANDAKGAVATGDGWQHLICPTNWVRVPGSTTAGLGGGVYVNGTRTRHDGSTRILSDFCVMKYEAKIELSGVLQPKGDADDDEVDLTNAGVVASAMPVSRPDGRPMVYVERTADDDLIGAVGLCNKINGSGLVSASLDSNFTLINNAQWQAIARDVENNSTDNTNAGVYNRGHSDNGPSQSLAGSSDDSLGCIGVTSNGDPDDDCGSVVHINKRTHTMTNGEVIWDIAGNVWEWVIDDVGAGFNPIIPAPVLSSVWDVDYTDAAFSTANRLTFGPDGSSLTSSEGIGKFYGGFGSYGGAAIRGGLWDLGSGAGLFRANLSSGSSDATDVIGARCVWAP